MSDTIKDLGNGLILRRVTPVDAEELVAFNARIHSEAGPEEPDERVAAWVHDLMTQPHPTTGVDDFIVVEDTAKKMIVSSMNLIPQTWSYAGIEFGVGRPELVGTDPQYRRRGLVRAQFDVIHDWSAQRGHKVQVITGIPHYYRQFGYEMGLALDGGRMGYTPHIPKLAEETEEPYLIRTAQKEDVPFINALAQENAARFLIHCLRDEELWGYELDGKSQENVTRFEIMIIESADGDAVGFLAHPFFLWGPTLAIQIYELKAGISWFEVTPSVLRYIKETGETYAAQKGDLDFQAFAMWLGTQHPVYQAIDDKLPRQRDPYAHYVRVADLPDFLRHIAPALEERLSNSVMVGYSGELKLCFFQSGIKFIFEKSVLKEIEEYAPEHTIDGDVLFPDLTFLRVLFGYNDFQEIQTFFADCYARTDPGRTLVPILFPKQASNVRAIS
jgi:hypothetical protein